MQLGLDFLNTGLKKVVKGEVKFWAVFKVSFRLILGLQRLIIKNLLVLV